MVSVVMPAYNEGGVIEGCVREWHGEVIRRIPGAELIIVDDCSTDNTPDVLAGLAQELPELRVIRTPRNRGHGGALRFGFAHVTREYVFQTDSDRQHVASDFWRLWQIRQEYDFVFGVRSRRADGWFRLLVTRSLRLVNFVILGVWIRDANCPFKLMRRAALEEILVFIPEDFFIPMVMLAVLARRRGYRIAEVEVAHLPRTGGHQSLRGICKWGRVGMRCLRQLLSLRLSLAGRAVRGSRG